MYQFLGLVAIAGLAICGGLLYGAILLFEVTLTLPGFAGLILTIGVAADANIVIFERIKEEVRLGKSVRAAIATGYRKGFGTIVDANVVTMITAFIIFAVASAGVKRASPSCCSSARCSRCSRRSRHARDARDALELQVVRQPVVHGSQRAEDPALAADRHLQPEAAPDLAVDPC